MDDSPLTLKQSLLVLHQAGIRHLLPSLSESKGQTLLEEVPWPTILAKLPPQPASIWTYPDLGLDLTGQADPARGVLWRNLIRHMDLPRGFIGFLPYCLPRNENMELRLDHFFAGLASVSPCSVLLFDDDPANSLNLAFTAGSEKPFLSIPLFSAPSPNALLQLSPYELQEVAARLKSLIVF